MAVRRTDRAPGNPVRVPLPDDLLGHLGELRVDFSDDDEPVLVHRDGRRVDTWREGYPYDERMSRLQYDRTKLLVLEGRDAAGKVYEQGERRMRRRTAS